MPRERQETDEAPEEPQVRETPREASREPVDVGAQVRSILGEMAKSGELVGGGDEGAGDRRASDGQTGAAPTFDLKGAIREVLSEERARGEEESDRAKTAKRLEALENPPKKSKWWDPWRP